jgi:hypothetical protein
VWESVRVRATALLAFARAYYSVIKESYLVCSQVRGYATGEGHGWDKTKKLPHERVAILLPLV